MKKTLIIALISISHFANAQSGAKTTYQIQETGVQRCLKYTDGTEIPVISYSDHSFVKCGTSEPRIKIPNDAIIRKDKECGCPQGSGGPYLKLAITTLTKSELETLIRTTDPNLVRQVLDTIYIGKGNEMAKLDVIQGDYFSAYVDNYTMNYRQSYQERELPAPMPPYYGGIHFDFDSSVLKSSSYPALDATAAQLKTSQSTITLSGYASSEGTAMHMMRLAKDRANSVKAYLVNSGVDAKRIKVKGYGETHPDANNASEEGRAANRKVEIKINN